MNTLSIHFIFPVQFLQINKNTNKSVSLSLPSFCSLWAGLKQREWFKLLTIFRNKQFSKSLESITKPMGSLILREKKYKRASLLNPQQYLQSRHQPGQSSHPWDGQIAQSEAQIYPTVC